MTLGDLLARAALRRPDAEAVVDGRRRLTYAELDARAAAAARGFARLGVGPGDRVLLVLRNRLEHVVAYWALQKLGGVAVPVNFRLAAYELRYVLEDAGARVALFEASTGDAVLEAASGTRTTLVSVGDRVASRAPGAELFDELLAAVGEPAGSEPPSEQDLSLILYTSGTTGRPKGVPRTHRNHYAGALAHVIQCGYTWGERTLGVMPLYHTMAVRSLLAMALVGGAFVCLPRFEAGQALELIAAEAITNLYLVPTLYHDLLHHPRFATCDVSSVKKLGFAGAPMTDGLLKKLQAAFRPDLFVNHYGSSEIYTFTIEQNAPAKPGSAGRAGINETVRVMTLGAKSVDELAAAGEEGEIIALAASDEAFEGYWRRPDADAKALRQGWYFTGDTGFVDRDGDLFVTGRVDDIIITGGENVSPVEIESCLSLHGAVSEVAVVGLPDERWGKIITAFVKRRSAIEGEELDAFCRASGLANFKRPRRYVFVAEIPKSPVGKLLRRKLTAGEYTAEPADAAPAGRGQGAA